MQLHICCLRRRDDPLCSPDRAGGIVEEGHARYFRNRFVEELIQLQRPYLSCETGHVAAGPRQGLYDPVFHQTTGDRRNDWDRCGRLFRRQSRRGAERDDHINMCAHEVGCKFWQSVLMPLCKALLDDEISALDIPKVLEPLAEIDP